LRGFIPDVYGNDHSYACLFADVNGDGAPDLVVGGGEEKGANASQVLLNDGRGRFTFFATLPPTTGPPNNAFVIDMKAGDVNGDGHVDLVFGDTLNDPWYVGTNIQVLINDGHGHFGDETATRLQSPPTQAKSWPQRVLLDDVNGDGLPDLTIQYAPEGVVPSSDPTALYLNEDGIFKPAATPADGYGREGGGIGWVNGDGPQALFSVEFHPLGEGPSRYYVAPQLIAPAAPTSVHARRAGARVRLGWTRVAGATHYDVRRNGRSIGTTTSTSYVDRRPGRRPAYTIRAVDAAGSSADSSVVHP
jgi:FG-GAP-like repeat